MVATLKPEVEEGPVDAEDLFMQQVDEWLLKQLTAQLDEWLKRENGFKTYPRDALGNGGETEAVYKSFTQETSHGVKKRISVFLSYTQTDGGNQYFIRIGDGLGATLMPDGKEIAFKNKPDDKSAVIQPFNNLVKEVQEMIRIANINAGDRQVVEAAVVSTRWALQSNA